MAKQEKKQKEPKAPKAPKEPRKTRKDFASAAEWFAFQEQQVEARAMRQLDRLKAARLRAESLGDPAAKLRNQIARLQAKLAAMDAPAQQV